MTLAVLLAVTTGAWAQEPKVWTTVATIDQLKENDILAGGFWLTGTGLDDKIVFNAYRHKENGALRTSPDGLYTMCFSSIDANGVIKDVDDNNTYAPVDEYGDDGNAWIVTHVDDLGTKIEIYLSGIYYDPNGVAMTYNDDRTVWTIDKMPASDVELTVRYYDDAKVEGNAIAATDVRAGEDKALLSGLSTEHGTLVYAITKNDVTTAPADNLFAADNNTAKDKDITEAGTYRVWYYVDPDATHSPSVPKSVEVTVLTNKFDITFTAANANTIDGTKATVSVKDGETVIVDEQAIADGGTLSAVTMGQTVILTAKDGYKIVGAEATAADGPTVYTTAVAISSLNKGDILAQGFSLTGDGYDGIYFDTERYKENGVWKIFSNVWELQHISSYGKNGAIKDKSGNTVEPVDENKQDGNAWEVTAVSSNSVNITGITYTPLATVNDAKTKATMTMPASAVALRYDLRRDMEVDVTAEMLTDFIRIEEDGGKLVAANPAELNPVVLDDLDGLLATMNENEDYEVAMQQKVDGQWVDATDLSVGTFRLAIIGNGRYGGTIYTDEFYLYKGFEVQIPAKSFATYIDDYNDLKLAEGSEGEIYGIYNVTATEVQLTAQLRSVAKGWGLLIYNPTDAPITAVLEIIDGGEEYDYVEEMVNGYYTWGLWTNGGNTIDPAEYEGYSHYVCNGKQFVKVLSAGKLPEHRWTVWAQDDTEGSAARRIVFGDATRINGANGANKANETYYDLSGRKLATAPTKPGIYVKDGKKVAIK